MWKVLNRNIKKAETNSKIKVAENTEKGKFCIEEAKNPQISINYANGVFDVYCPRIINPLEATGIKIEWGAPNSGHSQDKVDRFDQFYKTCLAFQANRTSAGNFKELYLDLDIYGRVIFLTHVGAKNFPLLEKIAPYALEGLNLQVIPYGKGVYTVQQIFNYYWTNFLPVPAPVVDQSSKDGVADKKMVENCKATSADAETQTEDLFSTLKIEDIKDELKLAHAAKYAAQNYLDYYVSREKHEPINQALDNITKHTNMALKFNNPNALQLFLDKEVPKEYLEFVEQNIKNYPISTGDAPPPYSVSYLNKEGWRRVGEDSESEDSFISNWK